MDGRSPGSADAHLTEAAPAGHTSPDQIRALLAGAKPEGPTASSPVDGSLHLYAMDSVMADIVSQAAAARGAFTLVMARPGPGVTPGEPVPTSTPAEVEDLAAALAVSVNDNQPLLRAGAQHLAVVLPGGARAGRREAMDVMRAAASQGAPLFTWASAHYPSDATTAGGLVEVASSRLDGTPAERVAEEDGSGRKRSIAAVWAGVAAALLVGLGALAFHGGSRPNNQAGAVGTTGSSQLGTTAASSAGSTSDLGSVPSGSSSSGSSGSAGNGYTTGSGSTSGGTGSTGTSGGTGDTGTTGDTSNGGNQDTTTTTVPTATTTTLPVVTIPTLPVVGTSVTTTTLPVGGTQSNNCQGLIQTLNCTLGGLLGGL